ncbi:hypothetical protein BDAP_002489 [Binucleata daphniae]
MNSKSKLYSGKIVVIGDGACGKTCLLEVFKRNKFPEDYIPTIIDNFVETININDEPISLAVWDTAGQEEYDAVRPVSYSDTDLVFLCYSIENKGMLMNIEEKWMPEIRNYCPSAGTFLVALKSDLRNDPNIDKSNITTEKDGSDMRTQIGAANFMECSAKENKNVRKLFEEAAIWLKDNKKTRESKKRWLFCFLC